jgi:mono/diheme cytochrome c family protein
VRTAAALVAGLLAAGAVLLALGGPAHGGDAGGGERGAPGAPPAGRAVFARMGCGGCHRLRAGGGGGGIGPDLDTVLPNYTAAALRAKIVDPYPAGDPAYFAAMPQDFGSRMSAAELDELVAFLLATTRR